MIDSSLREGEYCVQEEKFFVSFRISFSFGELENKKYFSKSNSSLIEGSDLEAYGKVVCCMFYVGVDPAQNLVKYKWWLSVVIKLTSRSFEIK